MRAAAGVARAAPRMVTCRMRCGTIKPSSNHAAKSHAAIKLGIQGCEDTLMKG